jgi:hypothetical protein
LMRQCISPIQLVSEEDRQKERVCVSYTPLFLLFPSFSWWYWNSQIVSIAWQFQLERKYLSWIRGTTEKRSFTFGRFLSFKYRTISQ